MKISVTIIPPTADLSQILRACCASGPAAEPALLQPFTAAGKRAGQMVTVATDGETICLWTAGRAGRFLDWASQHPSLLRAGENSTSPLVKFRALFSGGGTHPLQMARRGKDGLWSMAILTSKIHLTDRHHQILSHCDSCYLGGSTARPVDGRHPALSLRATVGKAILHGVIICPQPA